MTIRVCKKSFDDLGDKIYDGFVYGIQLVPLVFLAMIIIGASIMLTNEPENIEGEIDDFENGLTLVILGVVVGVVMTMVISMVTDFVLFKIINRKLHLFAWKGDC